MNKKEFQINKEQKEAIEFGEGPLLIVAGAGTGKTTVITQRIIYLLSKKGVKPQEILGLTFTDKAAQEMEDRVGNILPIGYYDLWISTFHSFCQRILKEHGLDIGISPDFRLLDKTQAWLLVRQNLDKFSLNYYRPLGNPTKHIGALLDHFSKCKDEEIYPEDYLEYADSLRLNSDNIAVGSKLIKGKDKKELTILQQEEDRIKEIADAYATYQKLLLDNDSLDFGDLLNYSLRLFRKRPKILEEYRQQFKYILVDEFQDTNYVQYELVKLLSLPRKNITVSADDDQAIYMWRGASFNNVLQFKKDFPESKEVILIKNYRSSQEILDLAYKFIQHNNPNRLEYQLNEIKAKQSSALSILKNFEKVSKKLIAQKKEKPEIKVFHFSTGQEEAKGVVNKIIEILKKDKKARLSDFAILVRANNHAIPFCKELERKDIPYQFLSSKGLYSKPVIIDVISYLKVLNNYYENSALFRILNLPLLNIPYDDISRIIQYGHKKGQDIYDTLQSLPLIKGIKEETSQKINLLLSLIKKHSSLTKSKKTSEVMITALKDLGYLKYLVKNNEDEGKRKIDLLNQFYNKIKKFEATQTDTSLSNFIKQIELELEAGEEGSLKTNIEEGPDMVNVLTVHSAKGLEFKYVFIVNLADKRFPTTGRKEKIAIPEKLVKEFVKTKDSRLAHLEEERRLFYVAITRAKKGLFLTWADNYGGATKKKPSRFLVEADLVKKSKETEKTLTLPIKAKNITFNKKEKKYPLPPYFSYTQLAAYQKCPLQYKLAHILKVPSRGKASFSFGKTMHKTLEDFLRLNYTLGNTDQGNLFKTNNSKAKKEILPLKDLLNIYERVWIDEWYENKTEKENYYKLGKEILKKFYNNFLKDRPKIKLLNGKPALEKEFYLKIKSYTIKGKIDRIDEIQGNKVEIIDYKTGNPKKVLNPDDKQQLLIYQIATEEILKLEPVNLTYYYLNDLTKKSFKGNQQDKEKIKEKIIEIIEKIKNNEFEPTPGWQCEFCDFKDICPYRSK